MSHSLDEVRSHAHTTAHPEPTKTPVTAEVHAVQLSYLCLGAMKSLSVLLSCSKYAELLLIPKAVHDSGHNSDCSSLSIVSQEEGEMRSALQFLMRHMVKRAVMRSPIKRVLGLAELERAQAMIYKLVVNSVLEEQEGGKSKPCESRTLLHLKHTLFTVNEHLFVSQALKKYSSVLISHYCICSVYGKNGKK